MSGYSVGRVLSLLSFVWAVRQLVLAHGAEDQLSTTFFLVWALLWTLTAAALWLGRGVVPAAGAVLALCAVDLALLDLWGDYALILMGWLALALLLAPHRRREQLLVGRVLLSTVYAFAALSKLQPSWLAGDNLYKLAASRPQSAWLEPFLVQPWLSLAAVAVVAAELWLALGLWLRRTRLLTAALGVVLHVSLTALATTDGMPGLLHLVALNGGLLLLYPAFWQRAAN